MATKAAKAGPKVTPQNAKPFTSVEAAPAEHVKTTASPAVGAKGVASQSLITFGKSSQNAETAYQVRRKKQGDDQSEGEDNTQLRMVNESRATGDYAVALNEAESSDAPVPAVLPASGGGGLSTGLIVGGLVLGGGLAAAVSAGGKSDDEPVNSAPTANATQTVTTQEDTSVTGKVDATDSDGDTLTYSTTQPNNGSVTIKSDGSFEYVPKANYHGSDVFTVTVSDGKGGTVTQTVNVTVSSVNDAPVIAAEHTLATDEDTAVTYQPSASDVDGDTLTYAVGAVAHGTAIVDDAGQIVFTPAANYNGSDASFEVIVNDGNGGTSTQLVKVEVAPVNDAPTFAENILEFAAQEDESVTFVPAAQDVDGDVLIYSISSVTNGTAVVNANGSVTFTPTADYHGLGSFVLHAKDPSGASTQQTVKVAVSAVNDAPYFAEPIVSAEMNEGGTFAHALAGQDVDSGDVLTYTLSEVSNGQAEIVDGHVVFTPDAKFHGDASFVITVTDKDGLSAQQVVNLVFHNQVDVVDLDSYDIPANGGDENWLTPAFIDVGDADYKLIDSGDISSNTVIQNFGSDDFIEVDRNTGAYNFTANADDLFITYQSEEGAVSEIRLAGVVTGKTGLVYDEASAEAALGRDFFTATGRHDGGSNPPVMPAETGSLDIDGDNNTLTQHVFDAGNAAYQLTEDANTPNYVSVSNFSSDDIIIVKNAAPGDFNFSASSEDIFIEYQTSGGISNSIVLTNAVHDQSVLVYDEATAEAAVGHDFFTYA